MNELTEEGCQAGPAARAFGRGPGGIEGAGPEEGEGSGLASSANSAVARPGLDDGRRCEGRGDLSAGGAAGPAAVPGGWSRRGAGRGREAEAGEAAGRAPGGCHRGDGLRASTAWSVGVVSGTDCRGGGPPKNRGQGGTRDDSPDAEAPRAEAVAGKKWLSSTSNG